LTQIQWWIWEEQLFEIKLQGLCHGNLSMLNSYTHLSHEQHLPHIRTNHTFLLFFFPFLKKTHTTPKWLPSPLKSLYRNPTLAKCEGETHAPKVGDLESSATPKNSELDCRGQNTSHWGVLDVNGKVLKCRCPQWPCMSHLDIWSPSYGQRKGRESNWQFDSRPLKVGNRPDLDMRWGNATCCWKALEESYMIGSDLVPIGGWGEKLWWPKVLGIQTETISGLHFGSPGTKNHLGMGAVEQRKEYYMGEGGGFPGVRAMVSQVNPRSPVTCPNTKKGAEWVLTNLWLVVHVGLCNKIIVPLSHLIPGLLTRPSYPL
jgi:hypothetical protein